MRHASSFSQKEFEEANPSPTRNPKKQKKAIPWAKVLLSFASSDSLWEKERVRKVDDSSTFVHVRARIQRVERKLAKELRGVFCAVKGSNLRNDELAYAST